MSEVGSPERFFEYVTFSNDCWYWHGGKTIEGYGHFWGGKKNIRAHRFSYQYFIGDLGKLHCLHHCDNPSCVNPWHLFAGTNLDNIKDRMSKGRTTYYHTKYCKRGHERTESNTITVKTTGARRCRPCNELRLKKYKENRKAAIDD